MALPGLNEDFERRPYWHATMPALPDYSQRPLPEQADVVVVGGGYTGVAAARRLAQQGADVTLLEARTLGWGASTRNGGIVHPGYKWGPAQLVRRYGPETGRELYGETLDGYALLKQIIADEAIDCEFRETGYLELAYAPSHLHELEAGRRSLADAGVDAWTVPATEIRSEIGSDAYYGGVVAPAAGLLHPGKWFAGLAASADRAGADLHEHAAARHLRKEKDGSLIVETDRGSILTKEVFVATNGYTDGFVPSLRRRIMPIGSYIIATEPLPDELARELSPRGRAFFDTKNFLYYWHVSADRRMVFGGRASMLPTTVDRTARILHRGMLEVHPQLAGYRIEYAWGGNVAFTFDRMPHFGRIAGVSYAMGCCGTGVVMSTYLGTKAAEWLGGAPAPALARLRFPLVPAPYEGRPWFLPFVGEWFRFQDRLAARSRPSTPVVRA
jgi:glycine/D-amino acid oxidase-like deaminating enzyme